MELKLKKLHSFEENKDFEIIVFLSNMVAFKYANKEDRSAFNWAKELIEKRKIATDKSEKFLSNAKKLQDFFEIVFKEASIDKKQLELYFSPLIPQENTYDEACIGEILVLHAPYIMENLDCDYITAIATTMYYSTIAIGDFRVEKEDVRRCTTFEELMEEVEKSNIEDSVKWKIFQFTKKYAQYEEEIKSIISKVFAIYKENIHLIEDIIEPYILEIDVILENSNQEEMTKKFNMSFNEDQDNKTLKYFSISNFNAVAFFNANMLMLGIFYLCAKAVTDNNHSIEELGQTLKCLGEARKFEMILSLMEQPCNGKELAKRLGITPATISHHMSPLIANGIIYLKNVTSTNMEYFVNKEYLTNSMQALKELFEE